MRDGNLKKQAHLLSKAELKRRGITRYDAEIILAQGQSLPEPKVNLGSKIQTPVRRNQPVKVSELRLSPRKHVSSQSYLKSLSPDTAVGRESRQKKPEPQNAPSDVKQSNNAFGNRQGPLSDITSIKSEKQHSGGHLENNNSFVHKCAHKSTTRSQKNGHKNALKLDLDCLGSLNGIEGEAAVTGLRHSPRLKNKEVAKGSVDVKMPTGDASSLTMETGDPEITFKVRGDSNNRNIFTELQFDVSNIKKEVDDEFQDKSMNNICGEKCRSKTSVCNHNSVLSSPLHSPPPADMPHLIPYDSGPQEDISYKNSHCSPKLTSYNSSEETEKISVSNQAKLTHNQTVLNSSSSCVTHKSPVRKSLRNKRKHQGLSSAHCVVNGVKGGSKIDSSGLCSEGSLGIGDEALSLPSRKPRSKRLKGNKYKDGNVFDTFNSLKDTCSGSDVKQEVWCQGTGLEAWNGCVTTLNGHLGSLKDQEDIKNSCNSPRFRNDKGRKRRLSFSDVASPKFGEPLQKRIQSLNEDLAANRRLFANISPVKKVPKITIKMRKDPVLEKELENSTKSDCVHFKLESPRCSVQGTPDSSDVSDSDEEESPLNCTKFRPSLLKQDNGTVRSLYKSSGQDTDRACPKLMKIKFGGTQISINIPQQS